MGKFDLGQQRDDPFPSPAVAIDIMPTKSPRCQGPSQRFIKLGSIDTAIDDVGITLAQILPRSDVHHRCPETRGLDNAAARIADENIAGRKP